MQKNPRGDISVEDSEWLPPKSRWNTTQALFSSATGCCTRKTQYLKTFINLLDPRTPLQKGKVVVSLGALVCGDIPRRVTGKRGERHTARKDGILPPAGQSGNSTYGGKETKRASYS